MCIRDRHEFVLSAVAQGYGGVENMSLIPGTVGAAPIQNIGCLLYKSDAADERSSVVPGGRRLLKKKQKTE